MSDPTDAERREPAARLARLAAGAITDGDLVEARGLLTAAARELAALETDPDADPEYWPVAAGKDGKR